MRNTARGWSSGARGRSLGAVLIGALILCLAASESRADPTPDAQQDRKDRHKARPAGAGGLRPGKAMARPGEIKKSVMGQAKGRTAPASKGGKKGGGKQGEETDGKSGDGDKGGGKKGDKGGKGGKGAGGGGEGDGPWSTVNLPQELSVGIDYKKPKKGTKFSFNLVDADLIELIKIIGNITGKSFILGGKVPNIKATIYAPTQITAGEAYQAFLSVLQVNGLTVVPAGRYLKILAVGGSTAQNTPIVRGKGVPPGDQIVTRLHRLQHVSADELAPLLDRFKSGDGDITVYSPSNMLIITDYGTSIRRLLKLVAVLDVPGIGEQIWIEPVNYADATELADRIMEIFDVDAAATTTKKTTKKKGKKTKRDKGKRAKAGASKGSSGPSVFGSGDDAKISKILADERTNSLIIVSSESSYLRILELVKQLDVPIAGEGTLHVHKLQHADAEELAKVLNELSRRGSRSSSKKGKGKGGGAEGAASLFEGEVQISADKATNSLVIVGSLRDYLSLKQVIDALDTMKRQVYVEAVIMEVSLDKNRDLGMAFHMGNTFDSRGETSLVYGSSQPNDQMSSLMLGPGALSGLAAGIRGPDLEGTEDLLGPGISIPAFGVVLQALQTNSDVNVLSTPHILATDNVEATITVGENVPVQQGYNAAGALLSQAARGGLGGSGSSAQAGLGLAAMGGLGGMGMGYSIGRQNVGLTLKITPFINDDDQVRLEIDLEISEVKSVDPNMGPNISKQNAATTSVVSDQQTIVIGGLITDNQVETTQKVPVLGDIPLIGFFFRNKTSLIKKRNLLIFLTPYIIRGPDDFREIFNRKMAERREFIERYTAFEYHRYDPHLDWGRTNGAVAVINEVIAEAEEDERLKALSEVDDEVQHTPKPPIKFPHGVKFSSGGDGGDDDHGVPGSPKMLGAPVRIEAPDQEE